VACPAVDRIFERLKGIPNAGDCLRGVAIDRNSTFREEALVILGRLREQASIPALLSMLDEPQPPENGQTIEQLRMAATIRDKAIDALMQHTSPEVAERFAPFLLAPPKSTRPAAADVYRLLARVGGEGNVARLAALDVARREDCTGIGWTNLCNTFDGKLPNDGVCEKFYEKDARRWRSCRTSFEYDKCGGVVDRDLRIAFSGESIWLRRKLGRHRISPLTVLWVEGQHLGQRSSGLYMVGERPLPFEFVRSGSHVFFKLEDGRPWKMRIELGAAFADRLAQATSMARDTLAAQQLEALQAVLARAYLHVPGHRAAS
jgi:hypothetical protein